MDVIEDIGTDAGLPEQCAHALRQTELHDATVSNNQRVLDSQALEIVCYLISSTEPELNRGHLHREDSFVGNIETAHTSSPLLAVRARPRGARLRSSGHKGRLLVIERFRC